MAPKRFLTSWKLSLIPLLLLPMTACTKAVPEVVTNTVIEKISVPIQQRPRAVNLLDASFRVVTAENLDEFLEEVTVGDQFVFIAMDVQDYENLSLNVDELRRYIEQQQSVILYYEESLSDAQ